MTIISISLLLTFLFLLIDNLCLICFRVILFSFPLLTCRDSIFHRIFSFLRQIRNVDPLSFILLLLSGWLFILLFDRTVFSLCLFIVHPWLFRSTFLIALISRRYPSTNCSCSAILSIRCYPRHYGSRRNVLAFIGLVACRVRWLPYRGLWHKWLRWLVRFRSYSFCCKPINLCCGSLSHSCCLSYIWYWRCTSSLKYTWLIKHVLLVQNSVAELILNDAFIEVSFNSILNYGQFKNLIHWRTPWRHSSQAFLH